MRLIKVLVAALLAINFSNVMAEKNNSSSVQSAEHWIQNGDIKIYVWELCKSRNFLKSIKLLGTFDQEIC